MERQTYDEFRYPSLSHDGAQSFGIRRDCRTTHQRWNPTRCGGILAKGEADASITEINAESATWRSTAHERTT
jgi:hypothetical protein